MDDGSGEGRERSDEDGGEAEEAMAKAETSAEKRKAKERKEDLMRLKRVEQIYVREPCLNCELVRRA